MDSKSRGELRESRCVPCEGGVEPFTRDESLNQLMELVGWSLDGDGRRIRRQWSTHGFMDAMGFFNAVAELAEAEGHHPDLHLTDYREVVIELWTHAIGGLSENDFILAAKIDQLAGEHL